jgi:membrane-associated progesterone receptor component
MVPWIPIVVPIVAVGVAVQFNKDRLNLFLMGFFRDLGRVKAYRRRNQGNSMALMTVLMKQEDPLLGVNFDDEPDDVPTYTVDELWEFGQDDNKLLLSVFGRIYDVSTGRRFYGSTARYNMFPGLDVTYALGSGCKSDECLIKTAQDLDEKQVEEAKRWLSYFQLHDKYAYVGKLENNPMEQMMEAWIEEAVAKQKETGEQVKIPNVF